MIMKRPIRCRSLEQIMIVSPNIKSTAWLKILSDNLRRCVIHFWLATIDSGLAQNPPSSYRFLQSYLALSIFYPLLPRVFLTSFNFIVFFYPVLFFYSFLRSYTLITCHDSIVIPIYTQTISTSYLFIYLFTFFC